MNTAFEHDLLAETNSPHLTLPSQVLPLLTADPNAELLSMLFDEIAHGVLIVDAQRWVLQANAAALRELQSGAVFTNQRGRLQICDAAHQDGFEAALRKAVRGQRGLIELKHESDFFSVALMPLGAPGRGGEGHAHIALFFSRPPLHESAMFAAFAQNQRLTRTEQQVLALLCRCLSTPEIAVELGVAVSTVRSHVRNLCAKTQTSGVRELVNRVVVLPPVAPVTTVAYVGTHTAAPPLRAGNAGRMLPRHDAINMH
jgi:DNA-binding CsgD family transcriptional regulator